MKGDIGRETEKEAGSAAEAEKAQESSSWVLSDRYKRGSHLYSTRTSDGFEATENASGDKVLLWILRFPLENQSIESEQFLERLERIKSLMVPTPRFRSYGLDASGNAYLVTDHVIGKYALDSVDTTEDLTSLFLKCLRALVPLHLAGVSLEDLSSDTFVVDSNENILILPLLGSFESGAKQTAMLPPSETLHYLAPEQRMGSRSDVAADMYALGVFGYRLFTGRFLHGDKPSSATGADLVSTAPSPSALKAGSPIWLDDVLGRCLEQDPSKRFRDASEILEVIDQSTSTGVPPGGSNAWSQRTTIVSSDALKTALEQEDKTTVTEDKEQIDEPEVEEVSSDVEEVVEEIIPDRPASPPLGERLKKLLKPLPQVKRTGVLWTVGIVLGIAGSAFLFSSLSSMGVFDAGDESSVDSSPPIDSIAVHVDYAPDELKPLIAELAAEETPLGTKIALLREISKSDDPTAYGVLIASLKSRTSREMVLEAQSLLLKRVTSQGLLESAGILDSWFAATMKKNSAVQLPDAYALLLRACDVTRPLPTRKNALQQAFATAPTQTTQLAAALALDESKEEFVPVLRKFLAGDTPKQEIEGKGLGALLFSHSSLRRFLQGESAGVLEKFSDQDLVAAMNEVTKPTSLFRSTELVFAIANEVVSRDNLSPYRKVFVQALVDNGVDNTSIGIRDALLRATTGATTLYDVQQFARWLSVSVDRVLLAICVSVKDPQIASEAFDILSSRDIESEPARSLFAWIKSKYWDYRSQAVRPIAVLGLVDVAPIDDVQKAIESLLPFSKGGLFAVMANSGNTLLQMEAIERLGAITASSELVGLLESDNKDIRLAVLRALSGRNELAVLRAILRAYKKETDEDVREAFRENHWVTRDRETEAPLPPVSENEEEKS